MNYYDINDNYGYHNYAYLNEVIETTLKNEKVTNAVCSIIFVDNEEIQRINREARGIDRVTDVISFALEDGEEYHDELRVLGDIYISIPKMQEQAKEYGHSEKRELAFLVVHGLLHLLGYDHTLGEKEEKEMFTKQELVLDEFEETKRS